MSRIVLSLALVACLATGLQAAEPGTANVDRSPADLVILPGEHLAATANQTSDSVSLVDLESSQVLDELTVGHRPVAVTLLPSGTELLVTTSYGGDLVRLRIDDGRKLVETGRCPLGFEPHGIATTRDGKTAYVALAAADEVAIVDLASMKRRAPAIAVGRWPRYLALNPDESRLAVGVSGSGGVAVVDLAANELLFTEEFQGLNLGHMVASADGQYIYFPWMIYRNNPITRENIRRGWVLASRIGRVRFAEKARREAISLDPEGQAVSDPFGLAITPDEATIVATAGGTQELLIYRAEGLPWRDYGGPGDHIDRALLRDETRFARVDLGGRPMGVRVSADGRRAWAANYLTNAVQEVDLEKRAVSKTIDLGHAAVMSLARRGEAIFLDGRRSLDQWYSCYSCHYDGGTNMPTMDTLNDGQFRGTFKTVKPLFRVTETGPWTWHGWQRDLHASLEKSLRDTMLGRDEPTADDVEALAAYLRELETPPNSNVAPDGSLSAAAERGRAVFLGAAAGCTNCHKGSHFTDGEIHDVGLGSQKDEYQGFNTPSLLRVAQRARWLHDGRAASLDDLLSGPHAPENVAGERALTPEERADLIEYLKTL